MTYNTCKDEKYGAVPRSFAVLFLLLIESAWLELRGVLRALWYVCNNSFHIRF